MNKSTVLFLFANLLLFDVTSFSITLLLASISITLFILGGKMSFPDFLKVMHSHSRVEDLPREIVDGFRAGDTAKTGSVSASHLKHMLLHWGEQLSAKEGILCPNQLV